MKNKKLNILVQNGLVAAIYAVLSLILAPISFGSVQCRISEALTLLPVLAPNTVWGVALGCAITNLVGASTGANFLGIADVFIGTAATLVATLLTAKLRHIRWKGLPILASLPPVLINAFVIGAEWCYVTTGGLPTIPYLTYSAFVGIGQLVSCCILGIPMVYYMEKAGLTRLFQQND